MLETFLLKPAIQKLNAMGAKINIFGQCCLNYLFHEFNLNFDDGFYKNEHDAVKGISHFLGIYAYYKYDSFLLRKFIFIHKF